MLDLTPEELALLPAILSRRLPDAEVRAFCSRLTGRAKPYPELDLVVMGDAPVDDLTLAGLPADLEESDLPFRVDVVLWASASPSLREAIVHQLEPLHPKTHPLKEDIHV